MYLIYTNEQDAWDRSEQEGIKLGLSYHTQGIGSRWVTSPVLTAEGNFALNVTSYDLTTEEQADTVESYNPVPNEEA